MANGFKDQVREGMEVFDADDEKIGTVAESFEGYLRIPSGFLGLGKEHYVPLSAIREIQGDEIHINVSRDRLDELESDVTLTDSADDEQTLQLREEELTARTQSVQTGEVTLTKDVVSEQRTLDVPVMREEVTIERHPVERRPADQPISDSSDTISVPVHEEQVRADKRTVVYEEVGLDKRAVQETEHVSDSVRREELIVDEEGQVDVDEANPHHSRPA